MERFLKITEIFRSLQGESDSVGWPTVFVRLTGCPLRCVWCDTAYAFGGGDWMEIDAVVDRVAALATRHVCVTGGEPLAQKRCLDLLEKLCDAGHRVSLETSGALPVADVDPRVVKVLDLKAPGSGESVRNLWSNLDHLQPHDQIKFVVADRADFDWAVEQIQARDLSRRDVLISPVWETLAPGTLSEWLLESGLHARLQVQLHKVLWGDQPGK
ncbi:MAG: 7-carboxy-7-deazaguanine synthase QueE [Wenzhouxiangellaceae bacterium]|nr:7-carboxy-7-deazaguanine synthase QueE [Wenzhouxiangellaceae bacterium]MBS3746241.1 7-carboxy-7-deazaguanine synthase QueE [Wenzhouxiangellaceae bacterium]MBS3824748.1 7-carboxy-7-deazaguanine synthase QueE [Wenzhouxiangellaceae bacterium]